MACSALKGPTGAGLQTCKAWTLNQNGAMPVAHVYVDAFTTQGLMSYEFDTALPPCETYDLAYWAPLWPVYIAALVTILCAKWLLSYFRTRESL